MRLLKIKKQDEERAKLCCWHSSPKHPKQNTNHIVLAFFYFWLPVFPTWICSPQPLCDALVDKTPSSSLALAAPRSEALAIPSAFLSCVQRPFFAQTLGAKLLQKTPKGKTDDGNYLFSNTTRKKRQLLCDFSVFHWDGPRSSKRYLPRQIWCDLNITR